MICYAHCSSSSLSTLFLQDLHLIWAALMSSQRAKQFKPSIYFQKWKFTNFVKFLVFTLHLSVALNIWYSLLSAAELRDGIKKQPSAYSMKGVLNSIKLWMLRKARYVSTLMPSQMQGTDSIPWFWTCTLQGFYDLSHSLLSLAFTAQWNTKHPSYWKYSVVL